MPLEIPAEFLPWVAQPGEDPVAVKEPVFCDHYSAATLMQYLPSDLSTRTYLMRHVVAEGNTHIALEIFGTNWSEPMKTVINSLQFHPSEHGGFPCLLANRQTLVGADFQGWSVIDWMVVKSWDSDGAPVHQDVLTFKQRNTRLFAKAVFSWLPYASMGVY